MYLFKTISTFNEESRMQALYHFFKSDRKFDIIY